MCRLIPGLLGESPMRSVLSWWLAIPTGTTIQPHRSRAPRWLSRWSMPCVLRGCRRPDLEARRSSCAILPQRLRSVGMQPLRVDSGLTQSLNGSGGPGVRVRYTGLGFPILRCVAVVRGSRALTLDHLAASWLSGVSDSFNQLPFGFPRGWFLPSGEGNCSCPNGSPDDTRAVP